MCNRTITIENSKGENIQTSEYLKKHRVISAFFTEGGKQNLKICLREKGPLISWKIKFKKKKKKDVVQQIIWSLKVKVYSLLCRF